MTEPRPRPRPTPFPSAPPVSFDKPGGEPPPPSVPPPPQAAPPYGYHPGYGYGMPWARPKSNGLGLAGMILGIVAIPTAFLFWGLVPAVLAIIFGAIGRSRVARGEADNRGQATAGLICGVVALVLLAVWIVVIVLLVHHSDVQCNQDPSCVND